MLKKFLFTILFFTVSVLVFADAFPCQPVWAAEPAVTEKNPESTAQATPQSTIEEKLKKIQLLLADSKSEKTEGLGQQLNIPLEKFQEKTTVLQEIEATYQRQLTALAKQSSLAQEQKNLNEQIDSQQGVLVSQLPPYSLSTYDQYLDQLEKAQQREKSANETLQIDKKNLEDAHDDMNAAAQQVRLLAEKAGNGGKKTDASAPNMQLTIAKLKNELSEATLDLNRYISDNTKLDLQIAQLQKKITQQQVDWVKSHLAYDEQDLQARLKLLEGLRQKLKSLMSSLAAEQQGVEDAWLKAQQEYSDTGINDELKRERSKSWLDARQAWRDTYQQVLEQTENSLRLISLSEDTWQRRYAIIKGEAGFDEFSKWEKETTESITNVNRLITMAQNSQSNLQPQIVSVRIQLAKQGIDPVVAKNLNTML
ncbi:MAG: hypothetical protein KJ717_07095, partial [Proteobacteria bacterium]|nr:hypothetical protein [Pseudomonadota bacterium]